MDFKQFTKLLKLSDTNKPLPKLKQTFLALHYPIHIFKYIYAYLSLAN